MRTSLDTDPVLSSLIEEALARRPEITQVRSRLAAERERVPQTGALPDPMLTAGIQNDGFRSIEVGRMETSYYTFMLTQAFPFPGKLGLRSDAAALAAEGATSEVKRAELSTEADVRTAYVGLLLARGDLALLGQLESIWKEAERAAKTRYEVGQGSQADLLRAQLERTRLRQQRWSLEASERTATQSLNRLRGRDLGEAITTTLSLDDVALPELPAPEALLRDADERSPELLGARFATRRASKEVDAARRDLLPDFTVSAGVMPRGGLPPMWTVSLGVTLPVYAASKQLRAIDEGQARARAEQAGEESVRQVLALRTRQRLSVLEATLESIALYRSGLLVQSEATVNSAVAQYQVGKVPFAAVLESINGLLADRSSYLGAIAKALQLAIDQQALSLDAPAGAEGGIGASKMGGSGGGASATKTMSGGGAGAPAAAPAEAASSGM
jgi:outer membrane protein TolC